MKILLIGSTGLVGGQVLKLALRDSRIEKVIAPVRSVGETHAKLLSPVVDFNKLPADADWWSVDAVICTLGTTIKKAGSQEAFRRVDHDYPIHVAELTKKKGAQIFAIVTAMGANAASLFFYNCVKGQVEKHLEGMNFRSLIIARPGLIGGHRKDPRWAEAMAKKALGILAPLLPKSLQLNPADKIASRLMDRVLKAEAGRHIITSDQMV